MRNLVGTLVVSLPAFYNVGALLFLFFFIYGYVGVILFGKVARNRCGCCQAHGEGVLGMGADSRQGFCLGRQLQLWRWQWCLQPCGALLETGMVWPLALLLHLQLWIERVHQFLAWQRGQMDDASPDNSIACCMLQGVG